MPIICSLVLLMAVVIVGYMYLSLVSDSKQADVELANAQQETTRLHTVILKVQQFEQRKAQLQQRVQLIEQLRKGQTEPVHMLDQVSRALPPMLWLTELKQTGNDIVIDGKCMVLTSLSDFVGNLEASGYFKKSVEIVNSIAEPSTAAGNLIKFSIKAQFQPKG